MSEMITIAELYDYIKHKNKTFEDFATERVTQGNGYYFYGTDRRFNIRATQSVITNCKCEVVGNIFDNPELLGR